MARVAFFISYTADDRSWAEWVAWQLEAARYTTVLQAWDFRPGDDFVQGMHQAVEDAERTIAVLSPSYLESAFGGAGPAAAGGGPVSPPPFPGPGPSISNLAPRNPHFTGRDDLLDQLAGQLASGTAAIVAAHGLGGIGKTQLALEYAHRHAGDYDLIWWVPSESDLLVTTGLVALAPYRSAGGHVLVTSRNPAWGSIAARLPVDVLPLEEATAFLLARTGDPDQTAATELAAELGGLPLALDQAAAYAEETQLSLAAYLTRYRRYHAQPLASGSPPATGTRWPPPGASTSNGSPRSPPPSSSCA